MSELMDDIDGTVCRTVGFEVVRNDHRNRILDYCREHDVNALALLGLYVHMAAKPHGWKFSYRRLALEVPGTGEKAIRALLRHLEALGYYTVTNQRGDDGLIRGGAVFDAGNTWPAQSGTVRQTVRQPDTATVRQFPPHGDLSVKLTDRDETTTPTVRPSPPPGPPPPGGPPQLVNTDSQHRKSSSQSQRPPLGTEPNGQAATGRAVDVDLTDDEQPRRTDQVSRYLDDLERTTGLHFQRNTQARQAVATAWRLGYPTASAALDAMTKQGHSVERAGAGLILQLLTQLPDRATARDKAADERAKARARAAARLNTDGLHTLAELLPEDLAAMPVRERLRWLAANNPAS